MAMLGLFSSALFFFPNSHPKILIAASEPLRQQPSYRLWSGLIVYREGRDVKAGRSSFAALLFEGPSRRPDGVFLAVIIHSFKVLREGIAFFC